MTSPAVAPDVSVTLVWLPFAFTFDIVKSVESCCKSPFLNTRNLWSQNSNTFASEELSAPSNTV